MPVTMEQVLTELYPDEPDYSRAAQLGPDALPHLKRLVEGNDLGLASKATYLAGFINEEQSVEVISTAARSPDPILRVAAAGALRSLKDAPASLITSLLKDEDVGVRKLALTSLAIHLPSGFRTQVQEMARNDPDMALRQLASQTAHILP